MKTDGVADEVRQLPETRNEVASDTVIGIEERILLLQADPAPSEYKAHIAALRRKPLHEHRDATIVENTCEARLIGEDVAHGHALVDNQHGQLGNGPRTRPVRFEGLLVVLGRHGSGQRDGPYEVAGVLERVWLQNIL